MNTANMEYYKLITQEYIPDRRIVKMGNRYYIQLPIEKNELWAKLHEENVTVEVLLKWSWDRKKRRSEKK